MIQTVGVVGAGTMGNGIAQVFAQAGFTVCLVDVAEPLLDRARDTIGGSLGRFVDKGKLTEADRHAALARIATATSLDALTNADCVIEAIVENADAKRSLFTSLDAVVKADALLASNTSSISITTIGAATKRPDRVLGMHFTAVEAADFPGFIANRILLPMINEAIYAVMEGVGTIEAIDTVMKLGMNHPMGPLQLADFIGLDVCLAILNVLHDGFGDPKYRPCPLLRRMVAAGHLGRKSGQGFYTY
jgi:3-hydroxybutyryl-CoA dehydrogenase